MLIISGFEFGLWVLLVSLVVLVACVFACWRLTCFVLCV